MTYTEFIKGIENNIAKVNSGKLTIGEYEVRQKQILEQIRLEVIDECIRAIYENTLNPVWEYGEGVNDSIKALEQLRRIKT